MKQLTRHVREASTPSLGQRRPKSLKLGAAAHGWVGDDGRSPARRRPSKGLSSRWPALRSPASAGDFDQAAPGEADGVMDARGTEHTTFSHCALPGAGSRRSGHTVGPPLMSSQLSRNAHEILRLGPSAGLDRWPKRGCCSEDIIIGDTGRLGCA